MSAHAFYTKVEENLLDEVEFSKKSEISRMLKDQEDNENKQKLIEAINQILLSTKIRVPNLSAKDLAKVEKNQLAGEMEYAMTTHSNVIEDIYQLKRTIEDMKAIRNTITQILHQKFRFRNQHLLKTSKEIQTYISADPTYNQINIHIKKVEAQLEKSQEFSSMLKSRIGFIRDLTKLKTQELFGDPNGE